MNMTLGQLCFVCDENALDCEVRFGDKTFRYAGDEDRVLTEGGLAKFGIILSARVEFDEAVRIAEFADDGIPHASDLLHAFFEACANGRPEWFSRETGEERPAW